MPGLGTVSLPAAMLAPAGIGASAEAWSELMRALEAYGGRARIDGDTVVRNAATCIDSLGNTGSLTGPEEAYQLAIRELHHRVKNELQVIVSQMRRHSRAAETPNEQVAWSTCISQIVSMASLHDLLIPRGATGQVDLADLLRTICDGFAKGFALDIRIEEDLDSVSAPTAVAEALALMLNEALTNAVKHGATGKDSPILVTMKVRGSGQAATLTIANRRVADPVRSGGFGSRLIDMLAKKLGGYVSRMVADDTYTVACTFPLA